MAQKAVKRRADLPEQDTATPVGKKLRSTEKVTAKRSRRTDPTSAPVFVIGDEEGEVTQEIDMPGETQKSPKPPSAEEFKSMLREGLANVAKKEQLDQMMVQIRSNSDALISLERKVECTNDSNDRRFKIIEEKLDKRSITTHDHSDSRRAAYDKARRSMRVWPIEGDNNDEMDAGFRDFAVDALQIQDTVVRRARITDIVRVRSSPQSISYLEILVSFEDAAERDYYFSRARNLATYRDESGNPTAGVRMDIPPHLMATFRLLNDHGFDIKKAHGKETRKYVKFDDIRGSLYLEIKLPGQQNWVKVSPDQVRSFGEEKDKLDYSSIRKGMLLANPTLGSQPSANLVPLGVRPQSSAREIELVPSTSRKNRWAPPPRTSPRRTSHN